MTRKWLARHCPQGSLTGLCGPLARWAARLADLLASIATLRNRKRRFRPHCFAAMLGRRRSRSGGIWTRSCWMLAVSRRRLGQVHRSGEWSAATIAFERRASCGVGDGPYGLATLPPPSPSGRAGPPSAALPRLLLAAHHRTSDALLAPRASALHISPPRLRWRSRQTTSTRVWRPSWRTASRSACPAS